MAIKDMIGPGIGFSPGSVRFVVTRGLNQGIGVAGPYCVEAVDVYLPGAVETDVYLPGAVEVEVCN